MACYCDYDSPVMYIRHTPKARKSRRCYECGRVIPAGKRYERVTGIWERGDRPSRHNTCGNCVALRAWVVAHVPCLCWTHGNLLDECIETAREYAHEAPGLLFGAYRRWKTKKYLEIAA